MIDSPQQPAGLLEPPPEPVRVLVPSPLGALGIEIAGQAVSRVVFGPKPAQRRHFKPLGKMRSNEFLDEMLGRLSEYFAGARKSPEIEHDLGPSGVDAFARRVLRETCRVPYGKTRSYHAIAEAAGRAEAYRQVLSILLANPIPILIPCHRIVTSKAGIGSYIGGTRRKRWLLRLEQQIVAQGG